ncbi:MAG: DNA-processing protein DprA [Sulfuricella sp.]|nr:DNA-processing protein DprA [Sulfuricella sp.]
MVEPSGPAGWIGLSLIPGVGGETYRRLLKAFGVPERIYAASHTALCGVVKPGIAQHIVTGVTEESLRPALDWLQKPGNYLVTLADDDYPQLLLQIPDPPPFFYLKGRRELLAANCFAVVGSRNATPQGSQNAASFSRNLSDSGLCIVSGMASGIDAAAHRGGLDGISSSIAVVGTGLDIVYPARNHGLAHELAEHGALISEFPLGTPAIASNFPRRNRIISGLSIGCLLVEAALRSGSLITARMAAEQGREVFAIPGSIHSPHSKGCHALIKQGVKLVDCAEDILGELRFPVSPSSSGASSGASENPDAGHRDLLDAMGFDALDIDTLAGRCGLTSSEVSAMLLSLELAGLVASQPGGLFQRITLST